MSVTMLPSGGTVSPTFRPDGKDVPPFSSTNATNVAKNPLTHENYMQWLTDQANNGNESALEQLLNIWSSEDSAKTAREWTAQREDNAYQRLMEDLKKAGISPYVLSGATPSVSSSAGKSYSGSSWTSRANNQDTNNRSLGQAGLVAALALLGIFVKALI